MWTKNMPKKGLSEARIRANKKWDEEHRERKMYIIKRSAARNFIKNQATGADLAELEQLVEERKIFLEN